MAPIVLPEDALDQVKAAVAEQNELTVDLEALEIRHPNGLSVPFEFDAFARHNLLEGLDDIGLTLRHIDKVTSYEATRRPWLPATSSS
jgi:3-isopropylmalate/(R)-2-methylmalate dehydratase small subunit